MSELPAVRESEARLLSGIDGVVVFDVAAGLGKLARQVAETDDWAARMESGRAAGVTRALELGPGNALARMMGNLIDGSESRSFADFRSIDGIQSWLIS